MSDRQAVVIVGSDGKPTGTLSNPLITSGSGGGGGSLVDQGTAGTDPWLVEDGSGLLATAAKQDVSNASLAALDGKLTNPLPVSSAAASQADGHSANIGTLADASSANTLIGLLKNLKAALAGTLDISDRAARLVGIVYGSLGQQLKQTATNFNLAAEIFVSGTAIDPRAIRALASGTDTVTVTGTVTTTPMGTQAVSSALASQVDGHSANIGTLGDASSANTLIGLLKNLKAALAGSLTVIQGTASALKAQVVGTDSDNSASSTAKVAVLGARANASAPAWTESNQVPLSTDLAGNVRLMLSSWFGSTAPTVGQKAAASSIPVVLASDATGPIPQHSTSGKPAGFTVSTSAVQIFASTPSVKGRLITNNGVTNVFWGTDNTVTATAGALMGHKIVPNGSYNDSGQGIYDGEIWLVGDATASSQNVSASQRS